MKSKNVSLAVEIYPREGTETICSSLQVVVGKLKFIPVRGRKRKPSQRKEAPRNVEIYPREGTET